jgi:hypothetical protein
MKKQAFLTMLGMAMLAGCAHHKATNPPPPPGTQTRSYYTKPLTTPGTRYSSLPVTVQSAVLAEVGTAEIANVVQEMNAGRVCFKIYFMDPATYPPLYIGSDGSVLNPDMTVAVPAPRIEKTVKFDDLPLGVTQVVRDHVPDAQSEVASIKQEMWGDHRVYIVSFKRDIRYPTLYVVADGTMLLQAH